MLLLFKVVKSCVCSSELRCSTNGLRSLYAVLAFPYSCRYLTTAATLLEAWPLAAEGAWELENAVLLSKSSFTPAREAFRFQLLSIPEAGSRWASISV